MLNFSLSSGQEEARKHARDFALKDVLPEAWSFDAKDEVPLHILRKAFEKGIMNSDIPRKYGGKGFGILEGALMTEEIAAACPGVATSVFDNSLGMAPLLLSDNESLKERYLPEIANEFKLICFGTSETAMGSDVAGMRCKATADGDDYILNGTKYWITNGGVADYMTVFATVDPQAKHKGIAAFLVDMNWDGVFKGRAIPKLGQRCSNTAGIFFQNVRVPKENIIAEPGKGFVLAMKTFSRTRPVIGAFAIGAARAAMEYALAYSRKRRVFGAKLMDFQANQFKLADMYRKIEAARLLTWKAAWEVDNGIDSTISSSIAKLYATESAMEVVNDALQLFGGYGYTRMLPIEKLFRDTRLFTIYEGTSEVQRIVLAGFLLGQYESSMPPLEDLAIFIDEAHSEIGSGESLWRCQVCGHVHQGETPPESCPYCFMPSSAFKKSN